MKNFNHVVMGLDPVADAFSGAAVYSDVINLKNWNHVQFLVIRGAASGAGTATITVEACDNVTPDTVSAVPFTYQASSVGDTYPAHAEATASGTVFGAGAGLIMKVDVDVEALLASGYSYVRLKSAEVADFTYVGCIVAILTEGRVGEDIPVSAIV
jgi:hypothetical protein